MSVYNYRSWKNMALHSNVMYGLSFKFSISLLIDDHQLSHILQSFCKVNSANFLYPPRFVKYSITTLYYRLIFKNIQLVSKLRNLQRSILNDKSIFSNFYILQIGKFGIIRIFYVVQNCLASNLYINTENLPICDNIINLLKCKSDESQWKYH